VVLVLRWGGGRALSAALVPLWCGGGGTRVRQCETMVERHARKYEGTCGLGWAVLGRACWQHNPIFSIKRQESLEIVSGNRTASKMRYSNY
jgi:hypothetical protein